MSAVKNASNGQSIIACGTSSTRVSRRTRAVAGGHRHRSTAFGARIKKRKPQNRVTRKEMTFRMNRIVDWNRGLIFSLSRPSESRGPSSPPARRAAATKVASTNSCSVTPALRAAFLCTSMQYGHRVVRPTINSLCFLGMAPSARAASSKA